MSQLEVRLLGNVEVRYLGRSLGIPAGQQRTLLASLALRPGHVLSMEEIAERLWGIDPPSASRVTIRTYVKRLRRVLDGALGSAGSATSVITTEHGGYQLRRDAAVVDADRFRALTARAAAAGDHRTEAQFLDQALALWRGEALSGVTSESLVTNVAPAMEEERLAALHRRIDLCLEQGATAGYLPLLRELLAKDPLQERFWAQLLQTLYLSGRPAEALREYERCRQILADSLGTDPGVELRQLHQRILAGVPAFLPLSEAPASVGLSSVAPTPDGTDEATPTETYDREPGYRRLAAPMQLPPDVSTFVGRVSELDALTSLLTSEESDAPTSTLAVVDGPAGVGKTGFAVHWAHREKFRYPDGQLYADLHGYGPKDPVEPTVLLRSFLLGLGVSDEQIPDGEESRSALLRSVLAGRRMLLVLDNARSPEQVRPLLPGGANVVLVTSRNQLRGLVAGDGAVRVSVPPLSPSASAELLRRLIPPRNHPFTEPRLAELAELCWRSPLLLRAVAERLTRHSGVRPAGVIEEIREAAEPLSVLLGSEDRTNMRTVLSWSFDALTPAAIRLFHLLCFQAEAVGGTCFDVDEAAALLSVPAGVAGRVLDELAEQHLLTFHECGGYGFSLPVACPPVTCSPVTRERLSV